jgi:hypothetical protein
VARGAAGGVGGTDEEVLMRLRLWWSEQRQRREQRRRELLQDRLLRELRRAAYGQDVPIYVDAAVLAQRLGVTASQLQPLLDRLAEQRLVFAGLTSGTYGVREWPPAWGQED